MKKVLLLFTIVVATIMNLAAQTQFQTTANLNMRSLPCTCAEVTTVIPKGSTISVLNYEDEQWARVSYNGHVNYVSRKYITPHKASSRKHSKSNLGCRTSSNVNYYTNSYGERVQSPTYYTTAPAGATALCRDGTYSFSRSRRGTCSHHGGVAKWL